MNKIVHNQIYINKHKIKNIQYLVISALSINPSYILMSSSHCGSGALRGGLRTQQGLDWAQAAFPMVEPQGEQNKHSCCASKGADEKEESTMNEKETSPCMPLKAQRGHSVLEVIQGTEVVEYRDNKGRREGRGVAVDAQQKNIKPPQQVTKDLPPFFQ